MGERSLYLHLLQPEEPAIPVAKGILVAKFTPPLFQTICLQPINELPKNVSILFSFFFCCHLTKSMLKPFGNWKKEGNSRFQDQTVDRWTLSRVAGANQCTCRQCTWGTGDAQWYEIQKRKTHWQKLKNFRVSQNTVLYKQTGRSVKNWFAEPWHLYSSSLNTEGVAASSFAAM